MKPARFDYVAPAELSSALDLLNSCGDDAKILAGGQSLGPLLNLRLAAPSVLVDVNRIGGLDHITVESDHVRVGALVRQRDAERSEVLSREAPVVAEALRCVGHIGIRNRGTVAGSVAHADPAAEMPAVLRVLEGAVRVRSRRAERMIPADSLFESYFTTAVAPDEMIVEVLFPRRPRRTGQAWLEFARRHGDFAIVGVGAVVTVDDLGTCSGARVVCAGVGSVPDEVADAAQILVGSAVTETNCAEVAAAAARGVGSESGPRADVEYARRLIRVLVPRALMTAAQRASERDSDGE